VKREGDDAAPDALARRAAKPRLRPLLGTPGYWSASRGGVSMGGPDIWGALAMLYWMEDMRIRYHQK
jgi:hypothetical protein